VGGWLTPRPGRCTTDKDPVHIVQEVGWAPGSVWTGAENLALTRFRSPDPPARSESLYRLSYPGPKSLYIIIISSSSSSTITFILQASIELSLGGSSPYTSTKWNEYTSTKQCKKHSTNNTKHSKYKYTYYQNTHTYTHLHITKLTPTDTHILQKTSLNNHSTC
jgi:hypothetical protein